SRGEQYSGSMTLMFVTMLALAVVLFAAFLAWQFGIIWYVLSIEIVVVALLYWSFNRIINRRTLVRAGDGLFSYSPKRQSE
ncbi:MAG TPA: hypothetical protein VFU37_16465, partial [Pyrinomonadaceae bacterium]|nr:hypothetical protein [Pyrinomonadaceae bacterium]